MSFRWSNKSSVSLLNDYDRLIQALFAEQSNKALETHKKVRQGDTSPADPTKFEQLVEIWERLLPHRELEITGDNIKVKASGSNAQYDAEEMSDGERAVEVAQKYTEETTSLNVKDIADNHRTLINSSIRKRDISSLMRLYDNKGLVALAAKHLKATKKTEFENWIICLLGSFKQRFFNCARCFGLGCVCYSLSSTVLSEVFVR